MLTICSQCYCAPY